MAAAAGLLITPSLKHLIVERGRSTARILGLTTGLAGLALFRRGCELVSDLALVVETSKLEGNPREACFQFPAWRLADG
jgi:hypothetical protein